MTYFLIDGYNLLHALGMAPKPGGLSLERARLRMIEWLAGEIGAEKANVSIVFDSANPRGGGEQSHRGLYMRFSQGQTADDLIEQLILDERVPAELTVVSNDHRLQQAARRSGCVSWKCEQYVDWLLSRKNRPPVESKESADDKPETTSDAEMEEWLKKFGER